MLLIINNFKNQILNKFIIKHSMGVSLLSDSHIHRKLLTHKFFLFTHFNSPHVYLLNVYFYNKRLNDNSDIIMVIILILNMRI